MRVPSCGREDSDTTIGLTCQGLRVGVQVPQGLKPPIIAGPYRSAGSAAPPKSKRQYAMAPCAQACGEESFDVNGTKQNAPDSVLSRGTYVDQPPRTALSKARLRRESRFRFRSSPRREHPRKLADAVPQLTPAFERPHRCLFLFNVREARTLHPFGSSVEALAAYGIHSKEAECLRERHTISSSTQKFNVRSHLPKNCTQSHFTERSLGNRPFYKQSRSTCQRETLDDTNELLVIDCEDCSFLIGDTDSRRSAVFGGLSIFRGTVSRITTGSRAVNVT